MKADIRDAATYRALRPLEIAAYLRAGGWKETRTEPGKWAIWEHALAGTDNLEISLPLDQDLVDFASRIGDVVRAIEVAEGRSQLEIISDLQTSSADVIRFRVGDGSANDGSVPIEEGVELFHRARDAMMAAACSTVERRAVFSRRKPNRASEYVRKVRMGQTERGSFVVTVISPVAPGLAGPGQLFEIEEPFERQVIQTLATGLAALRTAAERAVSSEGLNAFLEGVPKGISANLCDAIAGMALSAEGHLGIQVSFTWSRTRPQSPGFLSKIHFPRDAMPVIQEAGRLFRETTPRDDFELRGPVVKLERAEGAPTGKVTITGLVDDDIRPRKVVVELEDPIYHVAVQAHDHHQTVAVTGLLKRDGSTYQLKDPRGFLIEAD